ncbi:hypothetical protein [Nocardia spumae]|uniref:hypothetical protein n=1 Tax=Nocardia spumae TaxID=2887190 RepID=UPI001D152BF7|nr:hypothetical protein [Nocardia spumae]
MSKLLTIYLSDHYTGAVGGAELARRLASSHRGSPEGEQLREIADEVASDRDALRQIMAGLGIRPALYRRLAAWLGEKVARLKLNGRLLRRSPLSSLIELEAMLVAVEGKAAGWRLLRALAEHDDRFARDRLDQLEQRARQQADILEELRRTVGIDVLTSSPDRTKHLVAHGNQ